MPRALLLEIGCEELPTSFLESALEQIATSLPDELDRARIAHGRVHPLGTPRRIAAVVHGVVEEVPAREEEILGPPESTARTPQGGWSKAAEGFARKNEVPVDALGIAGTPKGRYLRVVKRHPGAKSVDLLPAVLAAVCRRLTFARSMRWADRETPFGRPVQWLVGLYGEELVSFEFAGVTSGRTSRGHRFLATGPVEVPSADRYVDLLRAAHVRVDPDERRGALLAQLEKAAAGEGGELLRDAFLEREVAGLVEEPHAVVGRFDPAFLRLPDELIESVMRGHQRYFAVREQGGRLLPVFITVANTALDADTIRHGNESVMRARLADAAFFVEQDEKAPLAARVPRLDGVVFHAKLGTYGDKVRRLQALAPALAEAFAVDVVHARRAAELCKTDLVSLTVGEFPELQGLMGGFYARHDGEPEPVAVAIAEHYQPRGAGDDVPASRAGAALAVADRLDTLAGCLAVGLKPSGSEDPFGLKRAAIGVLRTLLHHRLHLSLPDATRRARAGYTQALPADADQTAKMVLDFASDRLRGLLEERFDRAVVGACLAARRDDPVDVLERVEALAAFWATPAAADLAVAFRRVFNISREAPAGDPDRAKLTHPAEVALLEAFDATRADFEPLLAERKYEAAMELVARTLRTPVDRLFTEVFVMDKDESLRDARLRLLGRIADMVGVVARFDALDETSPAT